jgi:hypothetical protein
MKPHRTWFKIIFNPILRKFASEIGLSNILSFVIKVNKLTYPR